MCPSQMNRQQFHLQPFYLQQMKDGIEEDEFDVYPFLIFERPQRMLVRKGAHKYAVPVFSPFVDNHLLGFLPLPARYRLHWVYLCYQIVYHRSAYTTLRTAVEQLGDGDALDALTENFASMAAILKYLL